MHWVVECTTCPVALARCLEEDDAQRIADAHLTFRTGHVAQVRRLPRSSDA